MPPSADYTAGTIYDIGYRRYDGRRLGRAYAFHSLLAHSFRSVFGIGRGARAKIAPFALLTMALLPAIVQSVLAAAFGNTLRLVSYDTYFERVELLVALFCASQAPELVSADQHYHVLSLYFSRALERTDYALAKLLALIAGVLSLTLLPQLVIFLGRIFSSPEVLDALRDERHVIGPILLTTGIAACFMSGIALAIAAFTPRRAYGTAAVIGFFLLSSAVSGVLAQAAEGPLKRYAVLLQPFTILAGVSTWLFDVKLRRRSLLGRADIPGELYLAVALGVIIVAVIVLLWRYRRIRT